MPHGDGDGPGPAGRGVPPARVPGRAGIGPGSCRTGRARATVPSVDDLSLVSALRSGDVRGFAAVYDAYADRLVAYATTLLRDPDAAADAVHDALLVARERIGQLRDPAKLRPWLYAIVRNECLRQLRDRRRAAPLDAAGEVIDPTAGDPGRGVRADELRELVWAAAEALNPGEREVLELTVRHGLEGAELAAALGVNLNTAHALSSRARGQLERSLGALLVARTGGRDCPELAGLLAGWDGTLTPLLRKRLARHVERCDICGETRRSRLSPVALLAGVPFVLAPPGLREQLLRDVSHSERLADRAGPWRPDGFPVPLDHRRRSVPWRWSAAAVAVLVALVAAGLLVRPNAATRTTAEEGLRPSLPIGETAGPTPDTAAGIGSPVPTTAGTTTGPAGPTLPAVPVTVSPTAAGPAGTVPTGTPSPQATPTPTTPAPVTTTPPAPPTTTPAPVPAVTTRWSLAADGCPRSWRARLTATVTGTTAISVLATYGAVREVPQTAAMTSVGRGTWTVLVSLPANQDLTWTATASTAAGRIRSASQSLRHDCVAPIP